jgi:hypothetical protein
MTHLLRRSAIGIVSLFLLDSARGQLTNVQISADSVSRYGADEVSITINPRNPLQIAAGSNERWVYASADGGITWSSQMLHTDFGSGSDPSLLFDAEGDLFYASLAWAIGVSRSTDGGVTFDTGATVGIGPGFQDKETLTLDRRSGSGDAIAIGWTRFATLSRPKNADSSHIFCSVSRERGLVWSSPVRVDDRGGDCIDSSNTTEGAVPAFGPNGELYIVWSARDTIFFDRSTDGGATFGRDQPIAVQPGGWWIREKRVFRANGFPVLQCDQTSKFKGNLYVAFGDTRRGVPDAYVMRSTDGGQTWSDPQNLTVADTAHHLFPALTVDPITGHVFLVYYSLDVAKNYAADVYLARSTDGGITFETEKITESSFTPGAFLGDYISVAAYDRHIAVAWTRSSSIWGAIMVDTAGLARSVDPYSDQTTSTIVIPNPASGEVHIPIGPNAGLQDVQVYDALGRAFALPAERRADEIVLDVRSLCNGTYTLQTDRHFRIVVRH